MNIQPNTQEYVSDCDLEADMGRFKMLGGE